MILYDDYVLKDVKTKTEFWDISFYDGIDEVDSDSLFTFLRNVILNNSESIFCRLQALQNLISLTHIDKIKERKAIAILLDDMENIKLEFLICYRLKYLTLFYEKEKNEIKSVFTNHINHESELVKAEANYQLALTMFYECNNIVNKDEYLKSISETHKFFEEVDYHEDNRFDAKLFKAVCFYIISGLTINTEKANYYNQYINELLWEVILVQTDETANLIYFRIGDNISRINSIIQENPNNWLDYRYEFNRLCADFYELSNQIYKGNEFFNSMILGMNSKMKNEVIEPVFKYNYKATISKINAILAESDTEEKTIEFLKYMKNIITTKEIDVVDIFEQNLQENFPMLTLEDVNDFKNSLGQSNVSEAIYKIAKAINRFSSQELLNSIVVACIKLQANHYYKNCDEDIRNDYIRDLLRTKGYNVTDQSRQGASEKGKNSGEVDLLFYENEIPCALYEALNLTSLDKKYLNTHIDKIYKYDTLGYKINFLVSYVSVKNFDAFWKKYKNHVSNYEYPYALKKVDEKPNKKYLYSNLKIIATEHMRNGESTTLYHICILL